MMSRRLLLFGLLAACGTLLLTGCFSGPQLIAVLTSARVTGPAPLDVSFNLSYSEIPDGRTALFELDFGDASEPEAGTELDIAVHHTYEVGGTFVATLTITDSEGDVAVDHLTITVNQDGPPVGTQIGMSAPDFTATTTDAGELTLSDLRGQVVLLDFWGVWCGPCKRSMPHLDELAREYGSQGLVVVLISTDEVRQTTIDYLDEKGYDGFISVWEPGGKYTPVAQLYGVLSGGDIGIPHTFLIDRQGVIRFRGHPVLDLTDEMIEALL